MMVNSSQYYRGDEANLLPPLGGFAIVNLRAVYRVVPHVSVFARVQNLFDRSVFRFRRHRQREHRAAAVHRSAAGQSRRAAGGVGRRQHRFLMRLSLVVSANVRNLAAFPSLPLAGVGWGEGGARCLFGVCRSKTSARLSSGSWNPAFDLARHSSKRCDPALRSPLVIRAAPGILRLCFCWFVEDKSFRIPADCGLLLCWCKEVTKKHLFFSHRSRP